MVLPLVNLLFGAIFLWLARQAMQRALPFLRAGWLAVAANVQSGDYRTDVERRRMISQGGSFLLGGLAWLALTLGGGALGLVLIVQGVAALV